MHIIELIAKLLLILLTLPALYLLVVTLAANLFRKEALAENRMFEIGVIIPVHNDETGVARTIESIRAGNYPAELTSIFVIADN
jgi:cellulose synthase/poly-beta-1,6-N-acetylglucosamine synthase-like glycosyltransferase